MRIVAATGVEKDALMESGAEVIMGLIAQGKDARQVTEILLCAVKMIYDRAPAGWQANLRTCVDAFRKTLTESAIS